MDSLASKIHASFDFISLDLPRVHADFSCLSCKEKREPLVFPISCEHFWCFLWIPCPQGQWNKFLVIFWYYRVSVFLLTIFASPSAGHFFPILPRALAINDLAWMLLAVLSVTTRTTYIRLEVSHLIKWTEWNLSKKQTNLLIHRYSNSHRCGFLA